MYHLKRYDVMPERDDVMPERDDVMPERDDVMPVQSPQLRYRQENSTMARALGSRSRKSAWVHALVILSAYSEYEVLR